jgi:hypothetical protein
MTRHVMTARRKTALRKAQLASARKRKRGRVVKTAGILALVGTASGAVYVHKNYDARLQIINRRPNVISKEQHGPYTFKYGSGRVFGFSAPRFTYGMAITKRKKK